MNVFCHPQIGKWKSIRDLIGVPSFDEIEFGFKPGVKTDSGPDRTEVDMKIGNIFVLVEAKLTEQNFQSKNKTVVHGYKNFHRVFDPNLLDQTQKQYENYQLIRNILAAHEKKCRFMLLCDGRRPDLIRRFCHTVRCVKSGDLRSRCDVVFWQEVAASVGKDLRDFLVEKYGC
jgi:hypothetical protein